MHGHHIHAQLQTRLDHILALAPQRLSGALPGIATVQQQGAGAGGAYLFDQRRQMRKTAHFAVVPRRLDIIETGVGMRLWRARFHPEVLEQRLAHQMRRSSAHRSHTQIDFRLAEEQRIQLRVRIGDVQQADVAVPGQVVHARRIHGRIGFVAVQHEAAGRGDGQHLKEFAPIHAHVGLLCGKTIEVENTEPSLREREGRLNAGYLLTPDSGSSSSATRSLICASVKIPMWPKRGMLAQAFIALAL